ncbi:hypothetical protein TWF694_009126 [Orbilia ellipsospora]|uniref:Mtf2-like C-terminal domain-containing protein n=1 Tax=Orbilia ellipsospora TaxID=2528407 RepID=A0AAV9XHA5_9PEZI
MNPVKTTVSRCARRTIHSRGPITTPTSIPDVNVNLTMLSFLYPPAARRHLITTSSRLSNAKRASTVTLSKRTYSTNSPYNLPIDDDSPPNPSPQPSIDTSTADSTEWGYLIGTPSPEDELLVYRAKRHSTSKIDISTRHSNKKQPDFNDTEERGTTFYANTNQSYSRKALNTSGGGGRGRDNYNPQKRQSAHGMNGPYHGHTQRKYAPRFQYQPSDPPTHWDEIPDDPNMSKPVMTPRGNMTQREKTIFDTIFDKLLAKGGNIPKPKLEHSKPSPMISALFESAIGPQKVGDDMVSFGPERDNEDEYKGSMQAVLAKGDFPASLRVAAAGAMGLSRKAVGLEVDDEDNEVRLREYEEAKSRLALCGNDLEILKFLETEVFVMAGTQGGLTLNYPKLLRDVIRTFREEYEDFAACISVFEKIKQFGPESYIIGCSVAVYNEMLHVRWKGYRDVGGVVDLLEEMRLNGVEGDEETAAIVADVLHDMKVFESNAFLPGTVMMWSNENVLDGKEKLREIMGGLVAGEDRRGGVEARVRPL